jgi:NAD(P)-dependent dehydrogenase (short-subunit alcohol dehydrogenase family)
MGEAVGVGCAALGAQVARCAALADGPDEEQEAACEAAVGAALEELSRVDMLVLDGAALFSEAGLLACMQAAWTLTRSVFNRAFLPGQRGGRIVYLAPAPGADEHAPPARAGLENLARTLSIEWARHGVTAVTIAPGDATGAGEVAALSAYLASPAGAYFSGCLLDLAGC